MPLGEDAVPWSVAILVAVASAIVPLAGIGLQDRRDGLGREPSVTVLSSRPGMVTGGDALVRIDLPAGIAPQSVRATLNNSVDLTAAFRQDATASTLVGLVTGLGSGQNTLSLAAGASPGATLTLTNYPITGPVFSGPHESPFICDTERFKLRSGGVLGAAIDANCSIATRVDYFYRSTAGSEPRPLPDPTATPADVATTTTLLGATVPYIVRVETGSINRAIYQIAVLHNPVTEPSPTFAIRPVGWNRRLIYTFGGGCAGGWYHQGATTGGVENDDLLRHGYAVASSSLNVFGTNCNDVLSAETMMMVKEHFIEAFGQPLFTIGMGGSAGAMQVYEIADNYPGLLDGILPSASFPDAHTAISVHSFHTRMLYHYFQTTAQPWTPKQQVAASGLPNYDTLVIQGSRTAWTNPLGDCYALLPSSARYEPANNPHGARCDIYDHAVNIFGRDPSTGFARRPLDNVGVQYGLRALNDRAISKTQFLDLNEKIGGLDADTNFVPRRTIGDRQAIRIAYETGRLMNGGGGLAATPVIDYRGYTDFQRGDPHMLFYSFSTRERLIAANGHADNQVILVSAAGSTASVFREALRQMDQWLMNLQSDVGMEPKAKKTVRAKPSGLVDACYAAAPEPRGVFSGKDQKIAEKQTLNGSGICHSLYPSHSAPLLVAGMPLTHDVMKCELKPISASDYALSFTAEELDRLRRIFPDGVCDYTKPGVEQRTLRATWLSFGPSPTGSGAPQSSVKGDRSP